MPSDSAELAPFMLFTINLVSILEPIVRDFRRLISPEPDHEVLVNLCLIFCAVNERNVGTDARTDIYLFLKISYCNIYTIFLEIHCGAIVSPSTLSAVIAPKMYGLARPNGE